MSKPDIRIDYLSKGATYCDDAYGVYPDHSVFAGQESRRFLDSFDTLEEAQAAYPQATFCGCGYRPPYLGHLPLEDEEY